jgi:hypothetical protein
VAIATGVSYGTYPAQYSFTFDSDLEGFQSWANAGAISLSATGGEMVADVTAVDVSYDPQVFYEGFAVENGKDYTISFDAYTEAGGAGKDLVVNFGDALTADPWFTNFAPTQTFSLTESSANYSFTFTMSESSTPDQGKLVFEMGTTGGTVELATIHIDNILIEQQP